MTRRKPMIILASLALAMSVSALGAAERWPEAKAKSWFDGRGWLRGSNFVPSTAINQLEMWQAETFDPVTIDRELGWAASLGFNSMRVFLHDLLWVQDPKGFLDRVDKFLAIADKHGIGIMFVLFDSCWDANPRLGKQRDPKPGVHNSGWVQSPGATELADPKKLDGFKAYALGVVGRFADDRRVQIWDVWNEPPNIVSGADTPAEARTKAKLTLALLEKAFAWVREAKPSQPLTCGVWQGPWADPAKLDPTERFQLENSDVVSFHHYGKLEPTRERAESLRRLGRPIICSEYMARTVGSTFDPILGYLKEASAGAYNWGLVEGKTQTIYPWDSWQKAYPKEPALWFHDIFRRDGTPYRAEEAAYIRRLTGKATK
jgi:hypothetical protein